MEQSTFIGVYANLEKDIYDKLKSEAEAQDRSVSNMTKLIIKKYYEDGKHG